MRHFLIQKHRGIRFLSEASHNKISTTDKRFNRLPINLNVGVSYTGNLQAVNKE